MQCNAKAKPDGIGSVRNKMGRFALPDEDTVKENVEAAMINLRFLIEDDYKTPYLLSMAEAQIMRARQLKNE